MPDSHVGWVVQEGFEDAIRGHPDLDDVIVFPRRKLARWATNPAVLIKSLQWMRSLKQGRWDVVIDCQGLGRSGLMAWCSGASVRIGHRDAREAGWLGYNRRVSMESDVHTVDRMLGLLEPLGVAPISDMRLYPPADSVVSWEAFRRELGIESPYGVLATTTRWPSKAWPDSHWISLIDRIEKSNLDRYVLVGSHSERSQVRQLADRISSSTDVTVHDVSGRTTVGELMACIEQSAVAVANDTAALHMAVGLGGRCVGLYGPTDPAIVGPYDLRSQVVYASPGRAVNYRDRRLGDTLMQPVSVDDVVDQVHSVLSESRSPIESKT
tara:strand:- start:3781 stop:4755 length:975 start_codon:yes stop_codon:yes gene_type:complete